VGIRLCVTLLLVLPLIACGGSSPSSNAGGTTASPTPVNDPPPASLQILAGGSGFQLSPGEERQLTAWATYVDRAARAVAATWTVAPLTVASIDASSGKITARSVGSAQVTATFMNVRASQIVTVVSDLRGVWVGNYVLTTCTDTGQLLTAGWCRQLGGTGATLPMTIGLRDQSPAIGMLEGTLALGSIPFAIGVSVNQDGTGNGTFYSRLRTTPPFVFEFDDPIFFNRGFPATLRLSNGLSGTWKIFGYFEGGKGSITEQGDFSGMTKDPNQTVADPAAFPAVTSVSDLIARMKR